MAQGRNTAHAKSAYSSKNIHFLANLGVPRLAGLGAFSYSSRNTPIWPGRPQMTVNRGQWDHIGHKLNKKRHQDLPNGAYSSKNTPIWRGHYFGALPPNWSTMVTNWTKKDTKICKVVHILRRILQFDVDIISSRCPQNGLITPNWSTMVTTQQGQPTPWGCLFLWRPPYTLFNKIIKT